MYLVVQSLAERFPSGGTDRPLVCLYKFWGKYNLALYIQVMSNAVNLN